MKKAMIGYQLYSAREECSKDLMGVLKQLKALGYDGVEFAGFYGHTAEEIRGMLDEAGLVAFSDHVPYAVIEQDMFAVISDHLKIGCKYIAVPFLDEAHRPGQPGFADVIRTIAKFGALCKAAGIQLLYHNHDFEFEKISGMYALDFSTRRSIPSCYSPRLTPAGSTTPVRTRRTTCASTRAARRSST